MLANRCGQPEIPLGAHCRGFFSRGVPTRQFSPIGVRSSLCLPAAQRLIFHAAALMQNLDRRACGWPSAPLDCYTECSRVSGKARRIRGSGMMFSNPRGDARTINRIAAFTDFRLANGGSIRAPFTLFPGRSTAFLASLGRLSSTGD